MSKKQAKKDSKQSSKKDSTKNSKPNSLETQQQRRAKQKETLDNLNRENIQKYLKKLEVPGKSEVLICKFTEQSIEKIAQSLKKGSLLIPENSFPLPEKAALPHKLTYDEQKEIEVKAKRENMVKKIEYFYEQIRGENSKIVRKDSGSPVEFKEILTKEEHERRIREIIQDKEERQKRLQQLQQEQDRKQKEEGQKQKSLKQAQQLKAKEERRARIQENMTKRKQLHEKKLEAQAKLQKQRLSQTKKPKLYQEMEEKYSSQILLPYLQEKKNKLKELRDFKKNYEVDAIKEHEKQYLQNLQKSRERKNSEVQWKYEPPAKTERLARVLQDEEMQLKSHLQARKRRIQDMQQRQELFNIDLKQKFRPKIDQLKRKESEARLLEKKRDKIATAIEQRQLGMNYLQIAKKLRRSQSVKDSTIRENFSSHPSSLKSQTKLSLVRLKNHSQQFYQDVRRKKIQDIVNSQQSTMNEKFMMLKMQADKIGEKIKQKESLTKVKRDEQAEQDTAQLILSSIKAKMGIVNLLKHNAQPHMMKI